jgi:hypothetical protein
MLPFHADHLGLSLRWWFELAAPQKAGEVVRENIAWHRLARELPPGTDHVCQLILE